ncbi:antagonist of KipI [Virgibacillus natechei]|uniref:Antagonist of KipI n=1 Tax=Virgibacillus natechei TaxID=1216297 RepID=A0ABS4IJM1_9BACI|nr:biotin-dependent carboxyltransferase family protein [Virgibacillus natechei]MBP1971149.1 antagonist of KipI [Virgibacillus natechei]UZD12167.1 biotin-dependent carboxyltransferase family protein [Virgibacillus natechei]
MVNTVFEVIKPGLATSVQDLGRTGFQQYGVVVSGAMDDFALQVGNSLVGNPRAAAGLEIVIMGPELRIIKDTVLAICGADLSPKLDGLEIPLWTSIFVKAGQTLQFGQSKDGGYAYITVAGGVDTPIVMGSRATYTKAELGGFHGRNLQKGDRLNSGNYLEASLKRRSGLSLSPGMIPNYKADGKIRVVLGPDHKAFDEQSTQTFLSESYQVTTKSDRMGYRLTGPKLSHVFGADIISDAVFPGTIQVPANGEPIILLADRQTTGGYTRIATVISIDLPHVVQSLPGTKIQFAAISVEEAQALYVQQEKLLRILSVGAYK